jgi:hypothetical protein
MGGPNREVLSPLLKPYIEKLNGLRIKLLGDENTHDLRKGPQPKLIPFDEEARTYCVQLRKEYRRRKQSMTARSLPNIMRLALLYAVLDEEIRVRRIHLDAAVAFVRDAPIRFWRPSGNSHAAHVLSELRHAGSQGLTRTKL